MGTRSAALRRFGCCLAVCAALLAAGCNDTPAPGPQEYQNDEFDRSDTDDDEGGSS